jgi:hypothetical protein
MKYLLILFIVAVALAPLSHFMPSKRQRKTARLREYAAVHGLFVEFRSLPGASGGQRDAAGQDTIYYGRRLPASRQKGASTQAWLRDGEAWRPLERSYGIPAVLGQMPLQVLAASADENSCGAYWRESGEVDEVQQICQALEAWSAQLRE